MPYIEKEITSTDLISAKDALDKPQVIPLETLLAEIKNVPAGFDARDVDEYLSKKLGKVIRRTGVANGVSMNGTTIAIGLADIIDKLKVATALEEMFTQPLEEVRKYTEREKVSKEIKDGDIGGI